MKRIGILTFHRANNLGAALQATSLSRYINAHFGSACIIDFIPNNMAELRGNTLIRRVKNHILYLRNGILKNRSAKFDQFRKQYMNLSKKKYEGDSQMYAVKGVYSILISGSDQILNTTLSGNSKSYYLNFDDHAKKVSYASSFGRSVVSDDEIAMIRNELPKFHAISVRERSAGEIIEREIGVRPQLVVDPVFLMAKAEWIPMVNQEMKLPFKYIFVYSMEVSENLERVVESLAHSTGLSVIVVRGGGKAGRIYGKEDVNCGPAEFLRYIKDAEYVVTNSFHGTAFSIVFGKRFFCVSHSTRNTRLENIMEVTGNNGLLIDNNSDFDCIEKYMVDGENGLTKMASLIQHSKYYLNAVMG